MIKMTRAWLDSTGQFHETREAACKAEYRRAIDKLFEESRNLTVDQEWITERMFELDRIFGEATKEDSRVEFAQPLLGQIVGDHEPK